MFLNTFCHFYSNDLFLYSSVFVFNHQYPFGYLSKRSFPYYFFNVYVFSPNLPVLFVWLNSTFLMKVFVIALRKFVYFRRDYFLQKYSFWLSKYIYKKIKQTNVITISKTAFSSLETSPRSGFLIKYLRKYYRIIFRQINS